MEEATEGPVVAVEDLRYSYPGAAEPALRGVSFAIAPGEIVGFLGPNGAGKSTTQRVLTGLLRGYSGSVRNFGREVRKWGGAYYERIGVAAETPNLYRKLTGRENLRLFASLYEGPTDDPDRLLEAVDLQSAADRPVREYSKGMRMRLTLVRALLHDPPLLFLDEPTGGMDPSIARSVRALVRERAQAGTTVFLTTHDMTVADDLCDRVAFIVDGRIPVVDAPGALKRDYGESCVRVEYRHDGEPRTAEFDLATLGSDEAFRSLLAAHPIERIHSAEATLEDVFVEVTGRQLA